MRDEIRIIDKRLLADDWGKLTSYRFELTHRDGKRHEHKREVYDHGHAAVVLLVNPATNSVILIRQFRLPVHLGGDNGWLIEACAGLLDGHDPESCARREAEEETGYRLLSVRHAFDGYMSPGAVAEKLSFFIGEYDEGSRVSHGGGVAAEGEDIEVIELKFPEALAMIASGEIVDAKTILLLQHVALSGALQVK